MQGGTHEEMPCPAGLVVDGTPKLFAEGRMGVGVVKGEFIEMEVFELVLGEAKFPRDVVWADGEGVVMLDDEGHREVVK